MPYIVVDYSKCNGDGTCVTSCPESVFEVSVNGRWCKPTSTSVKSTLAIEGFHDRVLPFTEPIPLAIRYHVPGCYLCWQCIGACPVQAIDVDYDHLDIREYLLPVKLEREDFTKL